MIIYIDKLYIFFFQKPRSRKGGSSRTTLSIPEKEVHPKRWFGPQIPQYRNDIKQIKKGEAISIF